MWIQLRPHGAEGTGQAVADSWFFDVLSKRLGPGSVAKAHASGIRSVRPILRQVIERMPTGVVVSSGGTRLGRWRDCLLIHSIRARTNSRVWVHVHQGDYFAADELPWRWLLKRVERWIVPSQFLYASAVERGIDPKRVGLAPAPVPVPDVSSVVPRREASTDPTLLMLANFVPGKGHLELLNMLSNAPDRWGFKLVACGRRLNVRYWTELERAWSIHPHRARIALRPGGYAPSDLPRLCREADLLIQPSVVHEAQCLSVIEGMSYGLPAIVSPLGALPEAVKSGAGLVSAIDEAELSEAIAELSIPDVYQSCSQAALDVASRHSPERSSLKLDAWLRGALNAEDREP